jgi:hypothetical protein
MSVFFDEVFFERAGIYPYPYGAPLSAAACAASFILSREPMLPGFRRADYFASGFFKALYLPCGQRDIAGARVFVML